MRKIVAIIQARMGSTRLPGKVMKEIVGFPMLWHVVNRLKHSILLDRIVVATTINSKDDIIEDFCKKNNIELFRGNEDDVLDRYYMSAKHFEADIIVRITSDCPLIDPYIVDLVIRKHMNCNVDYTSNTLKRTYPLGLDTEVFNFSSLEKAYYEAKENYQREHVTVYFYENPNLFKLQNVENSINLSYLRWTVDEERDFQFVSEIYNRLYREDKIFLMEDIIEVLKKEPHLIEINKDVKQKKIK